MTRPRAWTLLPLTVLVAAIAVLAAPAAAEDRLRELLLGLQLTPLEARPAPPFQLERLSDGKPVSLAEQRGRPVLVYFWATW